MNFRIAAAAAVVLVLVIGGARPASAQESRPDRLAMLLHLEDSRSADVAAWKALLAKGDDAKFFASAVRGLGRVGEPELKPLLVDVLGREDVLWTPDVQRAAALAVGLFGDPELLPKLASKATTRDVWFAAGLMKKLPASSGARFGSEFWPIKLRLVDADILEEPIEAALSYASFSEDHDLVVMAQVVLTTDDASGSSTARKRAACEYFARSKAKAPATLRPVLTALLRSDDAELAGLAARALAKSEGAGDAEAAAIEAAFLTTTSRITHVDEVRALAALPVPKAFEALSHMLVLSRSDAAVRRTVLESLKAVAPKLPDETKKLVAATIRPILAPDEGQSHAPADVESAAVELLALLDPAKFVDLVPNLRLSASWQVRAAIPAGLVALDPALQQEHRGWVRLLLDDPDRRVHVATYEAITAKIATVHKFLPIDAKIHSWVKLIGRPNSAALRFADPVEISCLAALYTADTEGISKPWPSFLADAMARIPDHEVEALQSVLDFAGASKTDESNDLLRRYLKSPEISLRKRARELLKKNGIDAKEEPPRDDLDSEEHVLACERRAAWMLANPSPMAVIETNKGPITIQLFASDAPATVENFLNLAKAGFYRGILWHRVVPAFVAQAGCPRGDGWGGPGYTIRCEVSDRAYRRGSIGMALAGKDTGGCQFFICHRATPHLDGRYTLFGQVIEGMDVVDKLAQEDWIVRVREK